MSSAVQELLSVLDLEQLELNLFRGRSPQVTWQRVFGGQVVGRALAPARVRRYCGRDRPIELRPVESQRYLGKPVDGGRFHVWIRATGRLPDEPAIHQCVLAYASDLTLLDSALIPHGMSVFDKSI